MSNPDEKNWWERNVEDSWEANAKVQHDLLEHDPVNQTIGDVSYGVQRGVYNVGKGLVVGVVDLAIFGVNVLTLDPDTLEKTWNAVAWTAKEAYIGYFGSAEEKADQNRRANEALGNLYNHVRKQMEDEWNKAGSEGRRAALLARWATEGVGNIALLFVGAGEAKALASAPKAAAALDAASVVSKCPKVLAAEKAAATAAAEERARKAAQAVEAARAATAAAQGARQAGMTEAAAARVLQIAKEENVVIKMRPTNKECLKWIEKGHPAKPEFIKAKTMTADDIALGAPKGKEGLVWHKEPLKPPPGSDPKVVQRYEKRLAEFEANDASMQKAVREGKITIAEDGTVIDNATGKEITGDHDIYQIERADGQPMSPEQKERVVGKLKEEPVRAQHGAHTDWEPTTEKDQKIKDGIIDGHRETTSKGQPGEALVGFGPDGVSTSYSQ